MTATAAALALLLSAGVAAQDLPALHDVTGVAADDALNLRSGPGAQNDILGTLAHDRTGVEVVRTEDGWALVNTGEGSGWASLDYLAAQPGGAFPEPGDFRCFGTEPFWSLEVTQDGEARFTDPDREGPLRMLAGPVVPAEGTRAQYGLAASWPQGAMTLAMTRAACSDGMSDRSYGLTVGIVATGGMARVLSGCCSIEPR